MSHSPESGLAVVVMLVAVQILNNMLVASKIQGKVVDLHPSILAVLLVAGSQFGLLGVLLAAPVGVMLRDIYRYVNGRLSDPPRPAGLLPGDARKAAVRSTVPGIVPQQAGTQGAPSASGLRVPTGRGIPAYKATSTQRIPER